MRRESFVPAGKPHRRDRAVRHPLIAPRWRLPGIVRSTQRRSVIGSRLCASVWTLAINRAPRRAPPPTWPPSNDHRLDGPGQKTASLRSYPTTPLLDQSYGATARCTSASARWQPVLSSARSASRACAIAASARWARAPSPSPSSAEAIEFGVGWRCIVAAVLAQTGQRRPLPRSWRQRDFADGQSQASTVQRGRPRLKGRALQRPARPSDRYSWLHLSSGRLKCEHYPTSLSLSIEIRPRPSHRHGRSLKLRPSRLLDLDFRCRR